jgi:hypothetical protein
MCMFNMPGMATCHKSEGPSVGLACHVLLPLLLHDMY